ncbi:MAG: LacI family transcriptional regulator [Opitutaceae bacterium]|nr:LacI family transcriptional regulator [Opitutaceae bacterium]
MDTSTPASYRQIARMAGVSNFSVSCAMRNRPGVSGPTRTRIREIARKLGYTPNPMVTALMEHQRRGRRESLRSIIACLRGFPPAVEKLIAQNEKIHSTLAEPFTGAKEAGARHGFLLELFRFDEFREKPERFFRILQAKSVSGIILQGVDLPETWVGAKGWDNYSLAAAGNRRIDLPCDFACGDNHRNMWTLLTHLGELGYQHVGLTFLENSKSGWMERDLHRHLSACLGWHARTGRPSPSVLFTSEWSRAQLVRWVKRNRLDVFVAIDRIPLEMLLESGLRVPEDIGFAHLDLDRSWDDIAGMRTNNHQVGAVAAQLVIEQINRNARGIPEHPRAIFLHGEWFPGPTVRNIL